jgi:N-methylhydantoinase A
LATFGIDTGGTFTDLVRVDSRGVRVVKVPSTPDDPGRAVEQALVAAGGVTADDTIVHGTTVALNVLLAGRTARTALVTNAGFRDAIEIGRQTRPDIYALEPRRTAPLVPRALRFEVGQRSFPDRERQLAGEPDALVETVRPTRAELAELCDRLRRARVASVAVCLLHSYADPSIEKRVAEALAPLGVPITCSSDLVREHREFERFTTAIVNAALVPVVRAYLGPLEQRVAPARLAVLASSGGHLSARLAGDEPVRVLTSGPAGGVVGARAAARDAGYTDVVTLDMGGTSTDVAFTTTGARKDDARLVTDLPDVGGHVIAVPAQDLVTIGCGGGSLVRVDAAGVLHTGPQSAGADPGPVCHGRGDEPTVTDAHVLLGHVRAGTFMGGAFELDTDAVERAFERLGKQLGVDALRAARAVLASARAGMRRAIAATTHQRGHDPTRLPLVAFGGAGGLHAAALADALRMPRALVPLHQGALSALGMTRCGERRELVRTLLVPLDAHPVARRRALFDALEEEARAELGPLARGARVELQRLVDLRYRGQSFELRLADSRTLAADFARAHDRLWGHRLDTGTPIELVAQRVVLEHVPRAPRSKASTSTPRRRPAPADAVLGERRVHFESAATATLWRRDALAPGHVVSGPAVILDYSGTTIVPPTHDAVVTPGEHLELVRR